MRWLTLCLLSPLLVVAQTYTLSHRFLPDLPAPLGLITLSPAGASFDVLDAADRLAPSGATWYQVLLDVDGDVITASTKACCVTAEANLTVHLAPGDRPASLEVQSAPSGACPSGGSNYTYPREIYVALHRPGWPEMPTIQHPVSLTTDGKAAPPVVEKTFLQKYWMVIVGLALFLVTQMGPDEPRAAAAAK
ncbi:hypothetical protein Q5752_004641 [Cryptotrichosporon argae]